MTNRKRTLYTLAILYAAVMLSLLFLRRSGLALPKYTDRLSRSFNLVPFKTIRLFLHSLQHPNRADHVRSALINLIGNVLLFLPLGALPPLLWERFRRFWKTLLLGAGIMVVIELMQAALLVGTCDIDDLILNLIGAAIGYGIYRKTQKKTAM